MHIPSPFTLTYLICILKWVSTCEILTNVLGHPSVYQHLRILPYIQTPLRKEKKNLIWSCIPSPWHSVWYVKGTSNFFMKEMSEWKSKWWINDIHIVLRFEYYHLSSVIALVKISSLDIPFKTARHKHVWSFMHLFSLSMFTDFPSWILLPALPNCSQGNF